MFTGCSDGSSGGSDDDSGQVTTPAENPSNPDGGNTSNPGTSNGGNTSIYYTITFNLNSGEGTLPADILAKSGEEITLPTAELTRTGYEFKGWCATADGTGTTYEAGAKAKDLSAENGATVTLYAKWVLQGSWSINYVLNGDDVNPAQNAESNPAEYNIETEAVTLADPARTFYEFAGWYDNAEFSGEKLSGWKAGEKTGDITLYAKWTITQASVSEAIKNIPADGKVHTVALSGEISEDIITAIRSALYENSDARINLDISGTTGLTEIPEEAFYEWVLQDVNPCKALAGIVLPEGIESINQEAFETCSNLTDIVIPDSVKTIGALAFANSGLASIKFGSGLESIGIRAFSECNSLTEITVPGNVKTIEQLTFWNCENLEEVVLEEGMQTIGQNAFLQCKKLATVTIPKTVASIGEGAFYYCDALQTVNYGGTTAEWNALKASIGTDNDVLLNATIYCTDGIAITADKAAEFIKSLSSGTHTLIVTGEVNGILTRNGDPSEIAAALIELKKNCPDAKVILDLSGTENLIEIPEAAFEGINGNVTDNLVGVVLPNTVTSIGNDSFCATGLTEISIPSNVKSIGNYAFSSCKNLASVKLPDGLASIGGRAFRFCHSLKSIVIPDSVTTLVGWGNIWRLFFSY